MTAFTLTNGQQNALEQFIQFLADPIARVFVIEGFSGTGKTTLIKTLLDQLSKILKTVKLLNPQTRTLDVELTATTNKAAENFGLITGMSVVTIHSFLGLRVQTDYENNTTRLVQNRKDLVKENILLFIDEASYVDAALLEWIFKITHNCKIVFMGDPAQLTPRGSPVAPVFAAGFQTARLTEVVRHDGPILELATKFRNTVETGEFFSFKPDGTHIRHMSRDQFNKEIEKEFCRTDWKFSHSKFLAWTNKRVVDYNHHIRDKAKGDPNLQVGDYAICNKYVSANHMSLKTDQMVCITGISDPLERHGVLGNNITVDHKMELFFPKSMEAKKSLIKQARAMEWYDVVEEAENRWVDLRAAFGCTVDKSQGGTFDRVFIDLDDISRCNNPNQLARLLYVGVSRARMEVNMTGDLV